MLDLNEVYYPEMGSSLYSGIKCLTKVKTLMVSYLCIVCVVRGQKNLFFGQEFKFNQIRLF